MLAFERQIEDFCLLTRKANEPYLKIRQLLSEAARERKESLDRQNEF